MKSDGGFTLLEVMLVMTILLVLGAMAYPTYAGYITKTRRIEAQVAMVAAIQEQERYYSEHNTYVAFSSAMQNLPSPGFRWWSGASAAHSAYELEAAACPDRELTECVEVRATPGTSNVDEAFVDTDCATLTLNTAGEHGSTGPSPRCWP